MRDLAKIATIQKIESIPNYDRVELATVENYPVIVQKGQFAVGDLCVYVFYDTLLPIKPEFEFLRKNSYSKLYNMFRIRNMKMCGVYSSGLVLPLSVLPKALYQMDDDVTDILGVKKYDPEALVEATQRKKHSRLWYWIMKLFKRKKAEYPVAKSDEINVEKIFGYLFGKHPCTPFYVTEKMEGQSGTWLLNKKKYRVYSHNAERSTKDNNTWAMVGKMYDIENILRSEKTEYAIQGEICGGSIQKNIYRFSQYRLFVFKVTEVKTGKALQFKELVEFCKKHNLEMVPVLYTSKQLYPTVDEMLADCEGVSVYGDNVPREGLVWRSMTDQNIGCKCKSRKYQMWFSGNKETE